MMGSPVQMGIPTVALLPVEEIAGRLGEGDAIVAAMFLGVIGDAPSHMLFVMSEDAAHNVVDVLMGRPPDDSARPADAMDLSALQEVGNIMTGSHLGALAQITGLRLEPTAAASTQTRSAFTELATSIEKASGCVDQPAGATRGVSDVTRETRAAADQVSTATQQTSAAGEEVAASSEQLARTAERLSQAVERLVTE